MSGSLSGRTGTLEVWLGLFFLFSAAGWVWEVLFTALTTGQWVNRGMLHGPWLPVYGLGGVLLAAVVERLEHRWAALPVGAALGGVVEYTAALALEWRFRQRWWDYSGWPGSFQGRICLGSLAGFALAGWALYTLAPALRRRIGGMPPRIRSVLCRCVSAALALDWAVSLLRPNTGAGICGPVSLL